MPLKRYTQMYCNKKGNLCGSVAVISGLGDNTLFCNKKYCQSIMNTNYNKDINIT